MTQKQNGQGALALEPEDGLGEFRCGPSFDLDVGEAGGKHRRECPRGEFRGIENTRSLRARGGRNRHCRQRSRRGARPGEEVIDEPVLVFPVGGLGRGGNDFGKRTGDRDAQLEAQGGGEDRVDVLRAEDDATDFRKMRGDGRFQPSPIERRRDDEIGLELFDFSEQRSEFGAASGGFFFKRIEAGDVPVQRGRKKRRERFVPGAHDERVARLGPRGLELGESRGKNDEVADGIGTQINDALGRYGHGKGQRQRKGGPSCEPVFRLKLFASSTGFLGPTFCLRGRFRGAGWPSRDR